MDPQALAWSVQCIHQPHMPSAHAGFQCEFRLRSQHNQLILCTSKPFRIEAYAYRCRGARAGTQYESRLRAQHKKLNPRTSWAKVRPDDEATARDLAAGGALAKPYRLPARTLEVTPLTDGNKAEPSGAVVQSVDFHPNGQLLLTAGLDKRLRLFQVELPASCLWYS